MPPTTNNRTRTAPSPVNPDEKIIGVHMDSIEDDFGDAEGIMSSANSSAEEAKKLATDFPSLQTQADAVGNKIAQMASCFKLIKEARKDAKIAQAGIRKTEVESKAREVSNQLANLETLDGERKTLFDTVTKAADEKRHFKTIIEKIQKIQTDLQGQLDAATKQVTTAQTAVNEARSTKLGLDRLSGPAQAAAEKAQSFKAAVKEAEDRLQQANDLVTTLEAHKTTVDTALTNAKRAATANKKANADAALLSAENAEKAAPKTKSSEPTKKEEPTHTTSPGPAGSGGHGVKEKKGWFAERKAAFAALGVATFFTVVLMIHGGLPGFLIPAAFMAIVGITAWTILFPEGTVKSAGILATLLAMVCVGVIFFGWQLPGSSTHNNDSPNSAGQDVRVIISPPTFEPTEAP